MFYIIDSIVPMIVTTLVLVFIAYEVAIKKAIRRVVRMYKIKYRKILVVDTILTNIVLFLFRLFKFNSPL